MRMRDLLLVSMLRSQLKLLKAAVMTRRPSRRALIPSARLAQSTQTSISPPLSCSALMTSFANSRTAEMIKYRGSGNLGCELDYFGKRAPRLFVRRVLVGLRDLGLASIGRFLRVERCLSALVFFRPGDGALDRRGYVRRRLSARLAAALGVDRRGNGFHVAGLFQLLASTFATCG